jgi:hypothetical protein
MQSRSRMIPDRGRDAHHPFVRFFVVHREVEL